MMILHSDLTAMWLFVRIVEGGGMSYKFLEMARTLGVIAAEERNGSAKFFQNFKGHRDFDRLSGNEREFLAARDSFYMATISESGWPYVQHRGGPKGFLKVLDEKTMGFADFRGNLQYISLGNIATRDKTSLFFMDYPNRTRLKMFVHTEERSLDDDPALSAALTLPGYKAKVERALIFHLEAFDWNCPQHITPRYTKEELQPVFDSMESQLRQLQSENRQLRSQLKAAPGP
jgi:predicted pyridoxine 5'-phosphate oxidase superfamily flavin-nucleotide-binding protein